MFRLLQQCKSFHVQLRPQQDGANGYRNRQAESCAVGRSCQDENANNYDANATDDNGTCQYSVFGCTDVTACNYDSNATDNDGNCDFAPEHFDCNGACLADADGDGITTAQEARDGDAVRLLLDAGIPLIDDTEDGSSGSGLMHHKFVVVDDRSVITGSANFTSSGLHGDAGKPRTRGNVNHLLRIDSPALAAVFRREFERMWGDGPGGAKDSRFGLGKGGQTDAERVQVGDVEIEVLFAPHPKRNPAHGLNWLAALLASAKHQIDMALFVFSAQQLADVLEERANDGVRIRLVADPGFASRSFSEVLDLLGVALPDRDCKLEANNQPFAQPIRGVGTPRLARGDKLHHKFAVIDNKTVITGSFNWSPSAAHTNDETLLVIHSPQLAKHFTREMDRLWNGAELGITPHIQRKLDRQKIRCGDGVERG